MIKIRLEFYIVRIMTLIEYLKLQIPMNLQTNISMQYIL